MPSSLCKVADCKGFAYAGDGVEFLVKKWLVYPVQIYIFIILWPFEEGFSIKEESYPLFPEFPYILKRRGRGA